MTAMCEQGLAEGVDGEYVCLCPRELRAAFALCVGSLPRAKPAHLTLAAWCQGAYCAGAQSKNSLDRGGAETVALATWHGSLFQQQHMMKC